jgi:hypothetical protein
MAVYKIFPIQDTTLYSTYPSMNSGLDAMCEVFNAIDISGNAGVARYLTQFDHQEITDIINEKINGSQYDVHFKNYIATAQGINADTTIEILPLAQQWNNGTGHYLDSPQIEDGASWYYSSASGSGLWSISGSYNGYNYTSSYDSNYVGPGGGNWFTTSSFRVTQSFILRDVKDFDLNVTDTVIAWYSSSIPNYGFITKLSSSFEFSPSVSTQPVLKYYSVDTNTIYPPTLEFRWIDYTSSISPSASIVDTTNLKLSLAENPGVFYPESVNRFYVNVSPLYPARVYQTSSLFLNLNYLPTSSYYAIKDLATNEFIVNFDTQYTQISADGKGNYFDVYMSGLEPERYYKVLIKTTINGSTLIFDDDYYFKVVNG